MDSFIFKLYIFKLNKIINQNKHFPINSVTFDFSQSTHLT